MNRFHFESFWLVQPGFVEAVQLKWGAAAASPPRTFNAMDTWHHMRVEGGDNDLLQRLQADLAFAPVREQIPEKPAPEAYIGRAVQQVDEFLAEVYGPVQERYRALLGVTVETHV